MLSTNMELQESKVSVEDIRTFIQMIRDKGLKKADYLHLLKSVCSCAGAGVDCNQCRVADLWLEQAADPQVGPTRVRLRRRGERND